MIIWILLAFGETNKCSGNTQETFIYNILSILGINGKIMYVAERYMKLPVLTQNIGVKINPLFSMC